MRFVCLVAAGVFVLGAFVQWNDPDPVPWIAAYLVGAASATHAARGGHAFLPNLIAALVFAAWASSLVATVPDAPSEAFTSVQMRARGHEEPREAVGLVLLAASCGLMAWRARRGSQVGGSEGDGQVPADPS